MERRLRYEQASVVGLLIFLSLLGQVYAGQWLVSTGMDVSTGGYGLAQDTRIQAEYVQVRYEQKDWLLKLDMPYLHITGPSNARFVSDGTLVVSGASGGKRHIEGWGDTSLSATKTILSSPKASWGIDLTGKLKIPTADHQAGLGTGERDYTLQLDAYQRKGSFSYFSSLGYRWMGQPTDVAYRDILLMSAGIAYQTHSKLTLGLAIDYRQSPTPYMQDPTEWMLFASKQLTPQWKIQSYLYRGINEASPDIGGGIMLSRRL